MNYVNKRNENEAPETKIDTTNFYQGTGAKIFTAIVWIILVGFSIAFIVLPETIGGWNIIRFAAFASLWFSAYYINRKKTS